MIKLLVGLVIALLPVIVIVVFGLIDVFFEWMENKGWY